MLITAICMTGEDSSLELWLCFQTVAVTLTEIRCRVLFLCCSFSRLRLYCRCDRYAREMRNMSCVIYLLCTWRKKLLTSNVCGFIIPVPVTQTRNKHMAVPRPSAREGYWWPCLSLSTSVYLHNAAGLGSAWNTHTSPSITHILPVCLFLRRGIASQFFVFKAFDLKWSCEGKKTGSTERWRY